MITFTPTRVNNEIRVITFCKPVTTAEYKFSKLFTEFVKSQVWPDLSVDEWFKASEFIGSHMDSNMLELLNKDIHYMTYQIEENASRKGHQNCWAFEQLLRKG